MRDIVRVKGELYMTENNKGPMERYYNDVREYLKAKFPNMLDSDIQETAAFCYEQGKYCCLRYC